MAQKEREKGEQKFSKFQGGGTNLLGHYDKRSDFSVRFLNVIFHHNRHENTYMIQANMCLNLIQKSVSNFSCTSLDMLIFIPKWKNQFS